MSTSEYLNTEIAPVANVDMISVDYDLCEVDNCLRLATVRVERWVDPVPMDLPDNYVADFDFCDDHYQPDEERDRTVLQLGEVRS